MKKIEIKHEVTIGEILTVISIFISIVALVYSWNQDRKVALRSQANNIRQEASNTLAKVERWKKINLSFYELLDPYYVEASKKIVQKPDKIALRDFLWKKVNETKFVIDKELLDEQLESTYYGLLSYYSSIDTLYNSTMILMELEKQEQFVEFRRQIELTCLNHQFSPNKETAEIGSVFRSLSTSYRLKLQGKLNELDDELTHKLRQLILLDDQAIMTPS